MQTTIILSKCVTELKKDTPNIQYVLGMLETLIDMAPPQTIPYVAPIHNTVFPETQQPPSITTTSNQETETQEDRFLKGYLGQ